MRTVLWVPVMSITEQLTDTWLKIKDDYSSEIDFLADYSEYNPLIIKLSKEIEDEVTWRKDQVQIIIEKDNTIPYKLKPR